MISSVRRLPRITGTSGWSGSAAGDGAVMLLTGASWVLVSPFPSSRASRASRRQSTGRDAELLRRRARRSGACRLRARLGRRRAEAGDAGRRLLPLGLGHLSLVPGVGVVRGHPVLQRLVLIPARIDGVADVRDYSLHLRQAAAGVRGLHRLLVVRRHLGQRDRGLLVRAGQADPGDSLVDTAIDDDLALVRRDVV